MGKIIVGNWKMNVGPLAQVRDWARAISLPSAVEVVLSPSTPFLSTVSAAVEGTNVKVSAQDCSSQPEGAFTGDVSASMLKDVGVSYVIIGHSERRQGHGETSDDVRKKAAQAIKAGLIPIICIGESEQERTQGKAMDVVRKQVMESIPDEATKGKILLAYEPVWAIGSGKTPSADDIRQMHGHILSVAAQRTGLAPERISVLYGGSVKADNAAGIMAVPGVAGVLVGGASLKLEEFNSILRAA